MDTQVPAWAWACGAALCAAGFWWALPWRTEFDRGRRAFSGHPGAWLLPAGLAAADLLLRAWRGPSAVLTGPPGAARSLAGAAESLTGVITGAWLGQGAALAAGVLVFLNAGGCRRGLRKGLESVFAGSAEGALGILLAGWLVLLADVLLAARGLPAAWHLIASLLGAPAVGAVCAAVTGGWLLMAETARLAPEQRGEIRWLESAAAHAARLWPCAIAGALGWILWRWLPPNAAFLLRPAAWVLAAAGLFVPPVFLKLRTAAAWREGVRESMEGWRRGAAAAAVWLVSAGFCFFLFSLAATVPAHAGRTWPAAVLIPVAMLLRAAHTWLAMTLLGGWIMLRPVPPPAASPRPRRKPKPIP